MRTATRTAGPKPGETSRTVPRSRAGRHTSLAVEGALHVLDGVTQGHVERVATWSVDARQQGTARARLETSSAVVAEASPDAAEPKPRSRDQRCLPRVGSVHHLLRHLREGSACRCHVGPHVSAKPPRTVEGPGTSSGASKNAARSSDYVSSASAIAGAANASEMIRKLLTGTPRSSPRTHRSTRP
jgi:hypothetical protein